MTKLLDCAIDVACTALGVFAGMHAYYFTQDLLVCFPWARLW